MLYICLLTDLRNKTIKCCTFSVTTTIPESKIVKVAMKKFDEEEKKTFPRRREFQLSGAFFGEEKPFEKIFVQDGVSLAKLKNDFMKIFVKASSSQNRENNGL